MACFQLVCFAIFATGWLVLKSNGLVFSSNIGLIDKRNRRIHFSDEVDEMFAGSLERSGDADLAVKILHYNISEIWSETWR